MPSPHCILGSNIVLGAVLQSQISVVSAKDGG